MIIERTSSERLPTVGSLIVKLASRCNLDCDYCYIYHGRDQSWRDLPFRMHESIQDDLVDAIEYLYRRQNHPPLVAFHGGEPLLIGVTRFLSLVERILDRVPDARLTIQTNGTIYNSHLEQALQKFGQNLTFSISIDGFEAENDRHRLDRKGRSRYAQIEKTIVSARRAGVLDSILMVLDIKNAPEETFLFMKWAGANSYNLILRDGDHEELPEGKSSFDSTEVGQWLIKFAALYFQHRQPFRVQLLDDILEVFLARRLHSERSTDFRPKVDLTIETDGEIKLVDTLRVNAAGRDKAGGFKVSAEGMLASLCSLELGVHLGEEAGFASECLSCAYFDLCGGGYLQHRWGSGSYKNPSVYCTDYKLLFRAVEGAAA